MLSEPLPLPASVRLRLAHSCQVVHCELHAVSLDETALAARSDSHWLSAQDRSRAARFLRPVHARRWTRARAALRELLAERIGKSLAVAPFPTGTAGKPRPAGGSAWRFNVSHSHEMALIACAQECEPGVDIERICAERDPAALLGSVFSDVETREFDLLARDPSVRATAFMRVWTRKEAVLKASGEGIGFGLTRLHVGTGDCSHLCIDGRSAPRRVLCDVPAPHGYQAALCLNLPTCEHDSSA